MKNRGYSLEFVLFTLGILTFIIVLLIIIFQDDSVKKVDYTYKEMETSLVSSTKKYLKKGFKGNLSDGSLMITMNELYNTRLYDKIYDPSNPENICEGYVLVEIFAGVGFYEPFVKCGTNYITDDYR